MTPAELQNICLCMFFIRLILKQHLVCLHNSFRWNWDWNKFFFLSHKNNKRKRKKLNLNANFFRWRKKEGKLQKWVTKWKELEKQIKTIKEKKSIENFQICLTWYHSNSNSHKSSVSISILLLSIYIYICTLSCSVNLNEL